MKRLLLSASLLISCIGFTQTVIWTEDFDAGTAGLAASYSGTNGAWSVVSTGANGIDANQWYVSGQECGNAAGTGGSVCATDYSLHLGTNASVIGDQGAAYLAGGLGLWFIETHSRAESPTINLTGQTNMTLNFNYMEDLIGAVGYDADDIAECWYFDGTTWSLLDPLAITAATFAPQGTWTAFSIAMPASANNNPNVKIGFTWANDDDNAGTDPSIAVDDMTITIPSATNTITTINNIAPTSWCEGSPMTLQVNFTSTGTFNAGNIYTAELSDATGSFAAPLAIGTLASTANSGMVISLVPGATPAGAGYRIRVVSDNPATIGTDNGTDLVINPPPTVTLAPFTNVCLADPTFALTGGSPAGGTYSGPGVSAGMFNPATAGLGTHSILYSYTDGNGCSGQANASITVDACTANTITTGTNITPTSWCVGNTVTLQILFTSTGTFTAGNIYTAVLSDAVGSFAAPTVIGTLASTANSGMIVGIVLGSTPAGAGYRIRVVSSAPVTIGTDNGVDLVINPLPTVTQQPFVDVCDGGGVVNLVGASPAGGTYSGTGVAGVTFDPAVAGLGSTNITYMYTDGNGCTNSVVEPVLVIASPIVTMTPLPDVCVYDAIFTLTGGSPAGGVYAGTGVTANVFDPSTATGGTHTITYTFTDVNGCTEQASETIFVDACLGLVEEAANIVSIYPNPASSTLNVLFGTATDRSITLFSVLGEKVKTKTTSGLSTTFDVSELPSGVYMVQVESNNSTITRRVIVR